MVPLLFDRTIPDEHVPVPRSATPIPGNDETEDFVSGPVFHGTFCYYIALHFDLQFFNRSNSRRNVVILTSELLSYARSSALL